jgi:hypothetical protein
MDVTMHIWDIPLGGIGGRGLEKILTMRDCEIFLDLLQ